MCPLWQVRISSHISSRNLISIPAQNTFGGSLHLEEPATVLFVVHGAHLLEALGNRPHESHPDLVAFLSIQNTFGLRFSSTAGVRTCYNR